MTVMNTDFKSYCLSPPNSRGDQAEEPAKGADKHAQICGPSARGPPTSRPPPGAPPGRALGRREAGRGLASPGSRRERAPAESHVAAATAWWCGNAGGSRGCGERGAGDGRATVPGRGGRGERGRGRDGEGLPPHRARRPRRGSRFNAGRGAGGKRRHLRASVTGWNPGGNLIPGNLIPKEPGMTSPSAPKPRTQRRPSAGSAAPRPRGRGGRGRARRPPPGAAAPRAPSVPRRAGARSLTARPPGRPASPSANPQSAPHSRGARARGSPLPAPGETLGTGAQTCPWRAPVRHRHTRERSEPLLCRKLPWSDRASRARTPPRGSRGLRVAPAHPGAWLPVPRGPWATPPHSTSAPWAPALPPVAWPRATWGAGVCVSQEADGPFTCSLYFSLFWISFPVFTFLNVGGRQRGRAWGARSWELRRTEDKSFFSSSSFYFSDHLPLFEFLAQSHVNNVVLS